MRGKCTHVLRVLLALPEYAAKFTPPKVVSKNSCRVGIKCLRITPKPAFTNNLIIEYSCSSKHIEIADSVK